MAKQPAHTAPPPGPVPPVERPVMPANAAGLNPPPAGTPKADGDTRPPVTETLPNGLPKPTNLTDSTPASNTVTIFPVVQDAPAVVTETQPDPVIDAAIRKAQAKAGPGGLVLRVIGNITTGQKGIIAASDLPAGADIQRLIDAGAVEIAAGVLSDPIVARDLGPAGLDTVDDLHERLVDAVDEIKRLQGIASDRAAEIDRLQSILKGQSLTIDRLTAELAEAKK